MPVSNFVMHVYINVIHIFQRNLTCTQKHKSRQESERTTSDAIPYIAKLMLTYIVSYEFYHELSSVVKELSRSHRVYKKL